MKKSFNLFILSAIILFITIAVATLWDGLGLGENKQPLALSTFIALIVSIIGLVRGFKERKTDKSTRLIIALVGHGIVVLFFLVMTGLGLIMALSDYGSEGM